MFYLSHGKAQEKNKKQKKGRGLPRVPGHLALGEEEIKKNGPGPSPSALAPGTRGRQKNPRAFPECLGNWHSGKNFQKKKRISSPSVALGEEVKKKEISSPSVALGEE
jgi:hypothetical protein